MQFQREEIENFRQLFEGQKENIRNFPGCKHLELWQDVNQPEIFFTYSHWSSEDTLENYRHSDLFSQVWNRTKALFSAKAEAWSVQTQIQLP